jgi:hypothetical protein
MSEQSWQGTLTRSQKLGTFARFADGSWHRVNAHGESVGLSVDPPSVPQQIHQHTQYHQLDPYPNTNTQCTTTSTAYDSTVQQPGDYSYSQGLNTYLSDDPALWSSDMPAFQSPYLQGYTEQGEFPLEPETYIRLMPSLRSTTIHWTFTAFSLKGCDFQCAPTGRLAVEDYEIRLVLR